MQLGGGTDNNRHEDLSFRNLPLTISFKPRITQQNTGYQSPFHCLLSGSDPGNLFFNRLSTRYRASSSPLRGAPFRCPLYALTRSVVVNVLKLRDLGMTSR